MVKYGLPHATKIIRKPEPIGTELGAVSDAETLIALHLEIMEGKEDMALKALTKEYGSGTS